MNSRLKSSLIFLLKLVVTIVPAYFVCRNIVMDPEWSVDDLYRIFTVNSIWPLLAAVLCLAVSNFTACLQWKLLLERQDVKLKYGHLLKLYYVGLFFNNFMPGNVGGDAKKIYDIRMQGGQDTVGAGLTATFFDRLFGLFFITLFALAVGLLFFMHDEAQRAFMWPSVWIFLGFCALFASLFSRRLGKFLCSLMVRIFPAKINSRLVHMFERFQQFRSMRLWWCRPFYLLVFLLHPAGSYRKRAAHFYRRVRPERTFGPVPVCPSRGPESRIGSYPAAGLFCKFGIESVWRLRLLAWRPSECFGQGKLLVPFPYPAGAILGAPHSTW